MIPSPHPLTPEVNLEMSGSHMVNMNYVQMNTKKERKKTNRSIIITSVFPLDTLWKAEQKASCRVIPAQATISQQEPQCYQNIYFLVIRHNTTVHTHTWSNENKTQRDYMGHLNTFSESKINLKESETHICQELQATKDF